MAMSKKMKTPVEYSVCGIPLVEVPRSLLRSQPQFAERCDLSRLDDGDWDAILRDQPSLAAMRGK